MLSVWLSDLYLFPFKFPKSRAWSPWILPPATGWGLRIYLWDKNIQDVKKKNTRCEEESKPRASTQGRGRARTPFQDHATELSPPPVTCKIFSFSVNSALESPLSSRGEEFPALMRKCWATTCFICLFSHSVVSGSLQPHGLQHARLPCLSPTLGACSNSCPSSQWCHPTISSSVIHSLPAFTLSQHQGLFQYDNSY